uniref:Alpha-1,3/1,6-mannosyltransferase ALG2 n=1 Tax=Steinernema glaseri TaxID=37863 RepID=A0A1I7YYM9_9BILA
MRITFLHPDLGIGGAERLVVDAAIALQQHGHQVKMVTNQYSSDHCFAETSSLEIVPIFQWIPRAIFGRMMALLAYFKMILAAFYVCFCCDADVYFVDQVSACIPILKWFASGRVLFYCHFPDQLLTKRETRLKAFYRFFLDWLEEWSTAKADIICVNSKFTAGIVKETLPRLKNRDLTILYPSLNTVFFDECRPVQLKCLGDEAKTVFLSVNRFERKKNVGLALEAYALLKSRISEDSFAETFLVIAGGYDKLNVENREHYEELREKAKTLEIPEDRIVFLKSPSDQEKIELYRRATMVLYTPHNEHFGIVPVEAMYMKTCVVAVNSGGPTESIEDGVTGFLCESTPEAFAGAMEKSVIDGANVTKMGLAGHQRVQRMFGIEAFGEKLNNIVLLQ